MKTLFAALQAVALYATVTLSTPSVAADSAQAFVNALPQPSAAACGVASDGFDRTPIARTS